MRRHVMSASACATRAIGWRIQTTAAMADDWGTPQAIYLPLDREFDFTLDVAASPENAKHVRYLTKDVDALGASWAGERVFCNPPYGRGLERWMMKGFTEASEHGALVVFLVPARTDTRWFHDIALPHAEIRFMRGRLSYTRGAPGRKRAPFGSMVVIFRPWSRCEGKVQGQLVFPFTSVEAGREP
jgi:phage N-6-adenine-methyltransferase